MGTIIKYNLNENTKGFLVSERSISYKKIIFFLS